MHIIKKCNHIVVYSNEHFPLKKEEINLLCFNPCYYWGEINYEANMTPHCQTWSLVSDIS